MVLGLTLMCVMFWVGVQRDLIVEGGGTEKDKEAVVPGFEGYFPWLVRILELF